MKISLPRELQQCVTGKERDGHLQSLRMDIRAGFEAADRGEFTDYDRSNVKKLVDRVKARGRQRLKDDEMKTGVQ